MATTDQKLQIIIDAENKTGGAFATVNKGLDKFKSKVESLKPAFTKMAAVGTATFIGLAAIAKKSVDAYAEVERANRQLENAVIKVSKGTKEQVKAISDITDALQKKAGVDSDALKMGAAQLSTFGLQSSSVVKLTKSLADFTVNQNGLNASSEDYISSANTIAKALNGQFGLLERVGIRFTQAQQNMIKFGTESEKVAALQEGLAQNLRETTDTVSGIDLAMAKFKRTQEDLSENLGKALLPAFTKIMETLQPMVTKFAEWAERNPDLLAKIILLAGGIAALTAVVGTFGLLLTPIITGIQGISTAMAFLAANPVVLIGAGIAFIILKFGELVKITGSVSNAFVAMGDTLIGWWKNTGEWIYDKIEKLIKLVDKAASKGILGIGAKVISTAVNLVSGKRAAGGPVSSGQPYLVGENGPERFVPSTAGRIVKNGAMGTSITINFNGNNFMGEEGIAEKIGNKIIQQLQLRTKLSY